MDFAALQKLSVGDLFGLAEATKRQGTADDVAALYKGWIASHEDDPLLYAVFFNYGTVLNEAGDTAGAILALREAARLKPDFPQARLSLGMCLEKAGQVGGAIKSWLGVATDLAEVNADNLGHRIMALENSGRVLEGLDQDVAAEDALRQRLELASDDKVIQHWIALRMRQCKWPVLAPLNRVTRADLMAGISPLSAATLGDDPLFGLANAWRYNKGLVGRVSPMAPRPALVGPERLKIGYVSSDLREHAVGFCMAEIFELHDRARVSVHIYYCGIPRDDAVKARGKAAADQWTDISGMSDDQAAAAIRADGIDILIDLNGYTKDARTAVFARRPAPIAVNWFGFPSTMGSPYHHFILADAITIPPGHERYFSETVVRLPCYQPNDRKRSVAAEPPSRAAENLPADAVVFCCLNGLQKLTEATFGLWMRILAGVPAGVLWLLGGTSDTQARLRERAATAGVAPERLIFAGKAANPQHVARYALADLFLDNAPYGAHTTASDALWMGVPLLTVPGRSFASRVCASLITAAGLPELVCDDAEAYVAKAVALGQDRAALVALKRRLRDGRDTCLLFDTPRLVAELEAAYRTMWERHEAGTLPVPDLRNLDAYHEMGLETAIEASYGLDDAAYAALYHDKRARWDAAFPLEPDGRLPAA
ncbi:glycosyl transferase [Lichenihabitans sp. Uapishka_5]|uniref:O-linked N-acetylglucosamine transferase, SPINDLY family protein n=1 Tax=Lichenihabitans sp. Uapishka_5 TaxID=3037302 RepID=UPI0029E8059D|nr:glycosyl transferase [Lichenihabitans sp. Uapishka_5]MDX7949615.1 glycosyl transferase [Lichenihabitans sp. Uapishka_5]